MGFGIIFVYTYIHSSTQVHTYVHMYMRMYICTYTIYAQTTHSRTQSHLKLQLGKSNNCYEHMYSKEFQKVTNAKDSNPNSNGNRRTVGPHALQDTYVRTSRQHCVHSTSINPPYKDTTSPSECGTHSLLESIPLLQSECVSLCNDGNNVDIVVESLHKLNI